MPTQVGMLEMGHPYSTSVSRGGGPRKCTDCDRGWGQRVCDVTKFIHIKHKIESDGVMDVFWQKGDGQKPPRIKPSRQSPGQNPGQNLRELKYVCKDICICACTTNIWGVRDVWQSVTGEGVKIGPKRRDVLYGRPQRYSANEIKTFLRLYEERLFKGIWQLVTRHSISDQRAPQCIGK